MATENQDKQRTGETLGSENDWRSHVAPRLNLEEFPFEPGERVWILKAGFRAPLGPFIINRVCHNNTFELKGEGTESIYQEHVDGAFLKRQPF